MAVQRFTLPVLSQDGEIVPQENKTAQNVRTPYGQSLTTGAYFVGTLLLEYEFTKHFPFEYRILLAYSYSPH